MTARILYHREPDGWWAESPDIEGWTAAGESFEEVRELAEEGAGFTSEEPLELEHFAQVQPFTQAEVSAVAQAAAKAAAQAAVLVEEVRFGREEAVTSVSEGEERVTLAREEPRTTSRP